LFKYFSKKVSEFLFKIDLAIFLFFTKSHICAFKISDLLITEATHFV